MKRILPCALVRAAAVAVTAAAAVAVTAAALVTPASAADPDHEPQIDCTHWYRQSGVLVFVGYATVPPVHATHVTSFTLTCVYVNATAQVGASTTASRPVVFVAGGGLLAAGTTSVCSFASVTYDDGHSATQPYTCIEP